MRAYVVVEWTGSAQEVDGAILHGFSTSYATAAHFAMALRVDREHSVEIVEVPEI
jgi:hypothetical protein